MSVSVQHGGGGVQQAPPRHHQSSASSSLLACVRESSPLPDPGDDPDSYSGAGGTAEPSSKKRRFHPLRGLRRMFRRKARPEASAAAPEPVLAAEEVCGEPAGSGLLLPGGDVHPRSRSASELLGSSQELQAKRRSGGALSGGSGGGGSGGVLGNGLSVSHDSVFTSEVRAGSSSPRGGGSAQDLPEYETGPLPGPSALALQPQPLACHAGVRAELFEAVRRRRGRGRGRGGEASEDDDEDLGLPSSPYGGSPTTADVLMERSGIKEAPTKSHSTCSDGSLLSMGSSEMDEDSQMSGHSSKISLHDRSLLDAAQGTATDLDLEMVGESVGAPLSHSAARHKMAVRPRRTHGAPRHRRLPQVSSLALPVTLEAVEEFPRSYSPDNRGKKELCLPDLSAHSEFVSRSPPDGMSPPQLSARSPPSGLSPNSPEALLASVMLERQLKSASLPPGLAPPPATSPTEPPVKLFRSQSSSDPPASPPGRHNYRRAVSAARIEQAALANAAVSRSRAMFGGEAKDEKHATNQPEVQPEPSSPLTEEKTALRLPLRKSDEVKVDQTSPMKEEKSILNKPPIKPELTSPVKEDKTIFYKPPQSRKIDDSKPEPLSPVRLTADLTVQEVAPVPAPRLEPRKISSAALRQRVEPVLVAPDVPEDHTPSPWTPPANKVSVSHFIKPSEPRQPEAEAEVVLRHREAPAPTEHRLSVKNKVSDFQALLQDSPSSLDSLETETQAARRLRSLSQSPVDSLERTELKMSSDSLSSGADMSSTSDDPRPYLKHRRPRRPTPDTSDPDEAKPAVTPRPIKLRSVTRHSDPPFSGKNAVEITSVIRKSASVDSIRSFSENNTKNSSSYEPQISNKKSTSNDSISSFENIESDSGKNKVKDEVKDSTVLESQAERVRRTSRYIAEETKPVDIISPLEPLRLSLVQDHPKTENDAALKSPSPKWDAKPRLSISTPSVPEFMRVQLNHVDNTPVSNVVLSTSPVTTEHRRNSSEKSLDAMEDSEISSVRDRMLRKSFVDEPKVVEVSEKMNKQEISENQNVLIRRPSVKKMSQDLSIKISEPEVKIKADTQIHSPTEKAPQRISSTYLKEVEVKPQATVVDRSSRFSTSFSQPKLSITPKPTQEIKSVKNSNAGDASNVTIISRSITVDSKAQENRNSVNNIPKPTVVEKPAQISRPLSIAPVKVVAEKPVEQEVVVLRRKSVAPDAKREDEPELFKVFARRSLKLKDTDTWEGQASTQKSRDSDKENDENPDEIRSEKKSTETRTLSSSIVNNNVTSSVINTNNNNNNNNNSNGPLGRRIPRAASMVQPSNNNNNNNMEAINTEVTLRQPSPEKLRPRPTSLADKMHGMWGNRNIELVGGEGRSPAPTPAAPLPSAVAAERGGDKSLTPKVRRRMEEWERLAQQASR